MNNEIIHFNEKLFWEGEVEKSVTNEGVQERMKILDKQTVFLLFLGVVVPTLELITSIHMGIRLFFGPQSGEYNLNWKEY